MAVICLEPGEWEENLVIEKSITLRAVEIKPEPTAVIKSAKEVEPVILIESDQEIEVRIEGLKLTGAVKGDSIEVRGHAKAVIRNNTISGNEGGGIWMWGFSQATILGSIVKGNGWGIRVWGLAQAAIINSTVEENLSGIGLWDSARAELVGNRITANKGYDVALGEPPCSNWFFWGYVAGRRNEIHGKGTVCPSELSFLMTEEGGELDRRK